MKLPKTDTRYWTNRVFFPRYTKNGETRTLKEYAARMRYLDRRETFPLHTANKAAAAAKAREIYEHLRAQGWGPTVKKFKPGSIKTPVSSIVTVGDLLTAVRETSTGNEKTLADYARALRLIVSQAFEIEDKDGKRFNCRSGGGREKWLERVDAVKLSELTPERIQRWKAAYLKRKGGDPLADRTARNSLNSILRQAKSLFSPARTQFLDLPLGFVSPFTGIKPEPRGSMRYASKFDLEELTRAAISELPEEELKAFLLSAMAGLRRNEIDKLQWSAFDFANRMLRVEVSTHGGVKSEDSIGQIDLDEEFVTLFQGYRAKANAGTFVISDSTPARPGSLSSSSQSRGGGYTKYRAAGVFESLITWLRGKGVDGFKPLHTLRKEFGSVICQQFGIYAASRALRHADIAITSQHYLDKKDRTAIGLGHLLAEKGKVAPMPGPETDLPDAQSVY
jgi:integrase